MFRTLVGWALSCVIYFIFFLAILFVICRVYATKQRKERKQRVIGIFHPYCNDGGGGERVLWRLVEALKGKDEDVVIYTGDAVSSDMILAKVKDTFNISLPSGVRFVHLRSRILVEKRLWPRFTILGQSLGSIILGFEALFRECPDVYLETMGYAFTFPVFSLFAGCKVGCYVHYPTVSQDMLERVQSQESSVNNDSTIVQSGLKTRVKVVYYKIFAVLYRLAGSFSTVVMVNSSWTKNHIESIWKCKVHLVYPPVDCKRLTLLPLGPREPIIVSIAQFRKEKEHMKQLEAFNLCLSQLPEKPVGGSRVCKSSVRLVMMGSVRKHKKGDSARVSKLIARTKELGLEGQVDIIVGVSNEDLRLWFSKATVGLHTMRDEHFGIGVVELMAAGVVPIAHNSAGPKEDIVNNAKGVKTGFLATSTEEFASMLAEALNMNEKSLDVLRVNGRKSVVDRFSDEAFVSSALKALQPLLPKIVNKNK